MEIYLKAYKVSDISKEMEMRITFHEDGKPEVVCKVGGPAGEEDENWKTVRVPKRHKDAVTLERAIELYELDDLHYNGDVMILDGYSFDLEVKMGEDVRTFQANDLDMEMNELTLALSDWAMGLCE